MSPALSRGTQFASWALLGLAALFAGYQQLFSTFAEYDDEGYVMISLQSFLDGRPLYEETFTQYGPAYYFLQGGLHRLADLPITHHATRCKTLVLWLVTAGLSAVAVARMTRSPLFAWITFAAVFLHLDKLPLETGHPQEMAACGIAATIALATWLPHAGLRREQGIALALGLLIGTVAMIKINVGVLLGLGLWSGWLAVSPPGRGRQVRLAAVAAVSLLVPLLLFREQLMHWPDNVLPFVTVVSLLTAYGVMWRFPQATTRLPPAVRSHGELIVVASGLTIFGFLAATWASGTSWPGIWHGLITQHAGFGVHFFHPPGIYPLALPVALLGSVLLLWRQQNDRVLPILRWLPFALVLFSSWSYLRESGAAPIHGLQERGGMALLISAAPILMALLVLSPRRLGRGSPAGDSAGSPVGDSGHSCEAARAMLAFTAILQPLTMFPTPGTQTAVGSFPLLLGCLVLAQERLAGIASRAASAGHCHRAKQLAWGVSVLLLAALLMRDVRFSQHRRQLVPLALPGTGALRLPADQVAQHHQMVASLQAHADTFVFANHGRNSVYFWARLPPPTGWNATFWRLLFPEPTQRAIVAELQTHPRAGVIYEASSRELPRGPLADYLHAEFTPFQVYPTWQLWLRKDRQFADQATSIDHFVQRGPGR